MNYGFIFVIKYYVWIKVQFESKIERVLKY